MKRVLKWDVPVDDQRHKIGAGWVVHVECQSNPAIVQVWTEETCDKMESDTIDVQVFGTGQPYLNEGQAIGSAVIRFPSSMPLVWHVVKFNDGSSGYIKR